jgi:hypothetical protein
MRCNEKILSKEFNINIHETSIASYFKKVGLTCKPVKPKKRNTGAYRMDLLRDF